MHEIDLQIVVYLQDQLAVRGALVVKRIIRHRRKGRLETGQPLECGLRPRIFLAVERKAAVLIMNRDQALAEMTGLDGDGGLLLALVAEPVDVLPCDAFERRYRIRANALMGLRM